MDLILETLLTGLEAHNEALELATKLLREQRARIEIMEEKLNLLQREVLKHDDKS